MVAQDGTVTVASETARALAEATDRFSLALGGRAGVSVPAA